MALLGAREEDARLTALFLWTLQSTQTDVEATNGDADEEDSAEDEDEAGAKPKTSKTGYTLIYDVANPRNIQSKKIKQSKEITQLLLPLLGDSRVESTSLKTSKVRSPKMFAASASPAEDDSEGEQAV